MSTLRIDGNNDVNHYNWDNAHATPREQNWRYVKEYQYTQQWWKRAN
jgi:hypothetical protein